MHEGKGSETEVWTEGDGARRRWDAGLGEDLVIGAGDLRQRQKSGQ